MRFFTRALVLFFISVSVSLAQSSAPSSTPAAPAAPPSPSTGIRNKISAGDLLSAESILEVHRAKNGEDGPWLTGLSWLARGALLVGDTTKAGRYAAQVRASCSDRMARGADLEKDHDLEIAYGAAIEVEAQLLGRAKGVKEAAEYLREELPHVKGPVPLIARLNKRLNMLTLTGKPAPELTIEDFVGNPPPTLKSLRGKPVLLFIWYEGCGDCKAQEATLARVKSHYEKEGLQVVALTRYYEEGADRVHEKVEIDSVWKALYADVGTVPIVISTESMEQYGGSSTPTFVFLDREGIVRCYTPTRLTEAEFDRILEPLMR
jgi:thiol-disulfide isomerase/thioredoxin